MTPNPRYLGKINIGMIAKRVVFWRECCTEQMVAKQLILCELCGERAEFKIYELDGTSWYWCGECS